METDYNPGYFDGANLVQKKTKVLAYRTYKLKDGTLVGLFQGKKGSQPEIDFVLKMLLPGVENKMVVPTHSYWVVDLLLKIPQYRKEVREIVRFYIDFYDKTLPFASAQERNAYELETVGFITEKYQHLEQDYTLSLDYVATVVELFCKNEKLAPNAHWFRNLLVMLLDYIDNKRHFTEVIAAAQPGF